MNVVKLIITAKPWQTTFLAKRKCRSFANLCENDCNWSWKFPNRNYRSNARSKKHNGAQEKSLQNRFSCIAPMNVAGQGVHGEARLIMGFQNRLHVFAVMHLRKALFPIL